MDYSLLIGLHNLTEPEITESRRRQVIADERGEFEFYKDFGGFQSSYEDNSAGPEVYYLGKISLNSIKYDI